MRTNNNGTKWLLNLSEQTAALSGCINQASYLLGSSSWGGRGTGRAGLRYSHRTAQQQVRHVPVPAPTQRNDVIVLLEGERVIIKEHPAPVLLLDPGHVVPRVRAAALVREAPDQLVLACARRAPQRMQGLTGCARRWARTFKSACNTKLCPRWILRPCQALLPAQQHRLRRLHLPTGQGAMTCKSKCILRPQHLGTPSPLLSLQHCHCRHPQAPIITRDSISPVCAPT